MQRYDIFVDQCIDLAESLIIKSDDIARCMNEGVSQKGFAVTNDRSTWRYYLHLAGLRHPVDNPILIKSSDDDTLFELTPENLKVHKKTSNIFRYNLEYIRELIKNNPEYSNYIRGCFWPIPLERSVSAPDTTILYYNPALVEEQEQSLIQRLEEWLRAAHIRGMSESWKIDNDAYVLGFYLMLYPAIPARIELLRFQKVHTAETHSYFITEFLASHQELHAFIPYLKREQLFETYRNIRLWERNSGKQDILEWLVDTYFTKWNMPAVAYYVAQLKHNPTAEVPELRPRPIAYEETLNFKERDSGRDLTLTDTYNIINKEIPLAYRNVDYSEDYLNDLNDKLSFTRHPNQPTKLIEVTAIDPESVMRWDMATVLFNEWLHAVARGNYAIYHEILNPTTGDTLKLNSKELFALYLYAAMRGYSGVTLDKMPKLNAMGVLRKRWVTRAELLNVCPPSWEGRFERNVNFFLNTHYDVPRRIVSAEEMYETAEEILIKKRARWMHTHAYPSIHGIGAARSMFDFYYVNRACDLELPWKDYKEFFTAHGFATELISSDTWQDIAKDAFNIATSFDSSSSISQSEIQRAMVKLVSKLSSYTIHFASKMAVDKVDVTDPLVPTLDELKLSTSSRCEIFDAALGVEHTKMSVTMSGGHFVINPGLLKVAFSRDIRSTMNIGMGISVRVEYLQKVNLIGPNLGIYNMREDFPDPSEGLLISRVKNRKLNGFIDQQILPSQVKDRKWERTSIYRNRLRTILSNTMRKPKA